MSPSQQNRRFLLASRPTANRRRRTSVSTLSRAAARRGTAVVAYRLSVAGSLYARAHERCPSYAPPVEIGQVMVGGTVSRVAVSQHPDFNVGDWVLGYDGWQDYALSDGSGLRNLGPHLPRPSRLLGVLGMPGFTAYMGLLDIGQPQAGETLVVAAASGQSVRWSAKSGS